MRRFVLITVLLFTNLSAAQSVLFGEITPEPDFVTSFNTPISSYDDLTAFIIAGTRTRVDALAQERNSACTQEGEIIYWGLAEPELRNIPQQFINKLKQAGFPYTELYVEDTEAGPIIDFSIETRRTPIVATAGISYTRDVQAISDQPLVTEDDTTHYTGAVGWCYIE